MTAKLHWDSVYRDKAPDAVSWYQPHLERSIELIERSHPGRSASVVDVGGGESTLVDDLLDRGFGNPTVLDISNEALAVAQQRLGDRSSQVKWIASGITRAKLPALGFDFWHDRAVFHFRTDPTGRAAYVRQVARSVKTGGHVIVATFGPEGLTKCSGLDVVRYDASSLHAELGASFELQHSSTHLHETPIGTTQQFLHCLCRVSRQ